MAPPARPANARRLRWALFIALALHAVLLWRYAPNLFERLDATRKADASKAMAAPVEEIVEITPPPPPPKSRGMVMAQTLGTGSPERLQAELPKDFFAKPAALASGRLQLSDDLDFARATGAEIVANIIPAATRLPGIAAFSDLARTPKPKPGNTSKPARPAAPAAPLAAAAQSPPPLEASPPPPPQASAPAVPFLLPPVEDDYDVDAAIARAATAAERSARDAYRPEVAKAEPDYRAMLPQGPMVAAPPLPLGGRKPVREAAAPSTDDEPSGITTYALDAPVARDRVRAAPDLGKTTPAARQQYFSLLTARLKATNQRLLAEAVRAGPRTTVRMKFLVDRDGQVLELSPAEPVPRALAERAVAVIRAAPLPPVPATMPVPVELSFPVEVYQ